jgi:hypothetical protein
MNHQAYRVLLLLFLLLFLSSAGLYLPDLYAQESNRAGLVVLFGDGTYVTRCVEFTEAEISGYELLVHSNLGIEVKADPGMGVLVCRIGPEGCPPDDCMCGFPPNYWSYWHRVEGEWVYAYAGASANMVQNGDIDGWVWGEGTLPVDVSIEAICQGSVADTPQPPPTPASTDTTIPTDVPTSAPTVMTTEPADTSLPSPTLVVPTPTEDTISTEIPNPTPTETVAVEIAQPTIEDTAVPSWVDATDEPPSTDGGGFPTGYLFLGLFVVLLLAGFVFVSRRQAG